jgi:hypothetical protein
MKNTLLGALTISGNVADEVAKINQTYDGLKPYFDKSSENALTDEGLRLIYPYLNESGKSAFNKLKKEFGRPSSSSKSNTTTNYLLIGGAAIAAYFLLKKK